MKTTIQINALKALILCCSMALSACGSDGNSSALPAAQGTSDGGGGTIERSTEADIKSAVNQATLLLNDTQFVRRVFSSAQYIPVPKDISSDYYAAVNILEDTKMIKAMKYARSIRENAAHIDDDSLDSSYLDFIYETYKYDTFQEYLALSTIVFKEQGPCPSQDKTNADASVNKYELGAEICFSLENLKRIPRSELLQHVTSLLAHEFLHLLGFEEEVAILVQSRIVSGFSKAQQGDSKSIPNKVSSMLGLAEAGMFNIFVNMRVSTEQEILNRNFNAERAQKLREKNLKDILYITGYAHGLMQAFIEIVGESTTARRIFYLSETDDDILWLAAEGREIIEWLRQVQFLEAKYLLSDAFLAEAHAIVDRMVKMDEVYFNVHKHYNPNIYRSPNFGSLK